MKRVVVIVIDSGGVGALDDAAFYGDAPGADTIGNVARASGGLRLPNLERLGLGALTSIPGVAAVPSRKRAWRGCENAAAAKIRSPAIGR